MHGFINRSFQNYMTDSYGRNAWLRVKWQECVAESYGKGECFSARIRGDVIV